MPGWSQPDRMKKLFLLSLFAAAFIFDLAAVYLMQDQWRYFSKPLLMPLLAVFFISALAAVPSALKKWIILALLFSWFGDVFLMFEARDPVFFLLGLVSFLAAHIFYILFFHKVKSKENTGNRKWLLLPIVVYYVILITLLYPSLGNMKAAVPVYGIAICFMLLLALHMLFIKNRKAGNYMAGGAVLFVISDSVLAVNKFYESFEMAGLIIMLTYGLAQFVLAYGAFVYIRSVNTL